MECPSVMTNAKLAPTAYVINVTTNGASPTNVTRIPLMAPTTRPTDRPARHAIGHEAPANMASPATMPLSEKVEPTERSMPLVMMTSRTPSDMMTSGAAACATFDMLPYEKTCGDQKLTTPAMSRIATARANSDRYVETRRRKNPCPGSCRGAGLFADLGRFRGSGHRSLLIYDKC